VANNPVQKVDVDKSLVEAVKGALVEEETLRDFIEQAIRDRLKVLESKESK
jgi:DNA-binding protein YbaB